MKPKYIIIHHSLTKDGLIANTQAIRNYHIIEKGWDEIGYHFLIEKINHKYEIICGRMLNEKGAHCLSKGMNNKSIGICFIGNFDEDDINLIQYDLGLNLISSLMEIFNIPSKNILGHKEVSKDGRSCPGKNFNLNKLRNDLENINDR